MHSGIWSVDVLLGLVCGCTSRWFEVLGLEALRGCCPWICSSIVSGCAVGCLEALQRCAGFVRICSGVLSVDALPGLVWMCSPGFKSVDALCSGSCRRMCSWVPSDVLSSMVLGFVLWMSLEGSMDALIGSRVSCPHVALGFIECAFFV